ncbi:MAG: DEAD/DEAH box helicase [Desulfosarcinaceae bacterium]|nr:DEAD/DEAH box helicase [Desulfosarcinaceae bacterium]
MSTSTRRPGHPRGHRRRRGTGPRRSGPPLRLKPQSDGSLKRLFARIGIPKQRPFTPDPFQITAVEAIAGADSIGTCDCLVTAPTGSGKTWIAVEAIRRMRLQGKRAWYASPLKALTNAKLVEFADVFGADQVGILTGDRKENPDAPIIVGTTEILRNQLYDAMNFGHRLDTDLVILDEAHFMGDAERGVVWEEIMIYLPRRIPLLLLSATIGNADLISDWLAAIRERPCALVTAEKRPVPLVHLFLHPSGLLLPLLVKHKGGKRRRLHKKIASYLAQRRPPYLAPPGRLPPFDEILKVLKRYRLLPAIFFLKSRADCDGAVQICRHRPPLDHEREALLKDRVAALIENDPYLSAHGQRSLLEARAVGAHHSGQLPTWKLVIETLMTEGLLDAVFATSTVAAGVNFPARTIVMFHSDRFNGTEFLPLDATEFHQMTGRAGRRGMDRIGFSLTVPGKYMEVRDMAKLANARPAPVHSQIRINFSMALNLLLSHTPLEIEDLLKRSFATYLLVSNAGSSDDQRRQEEIHGILWEDFEDHLAFLKETGFVDAADRLTEDGVWASQLRIDQPLVVAEGLRKGILPDDDPALLAAVMAAFVNERESNDRMEGRLLPNKLTKCMRRIHKALHGFLRHLVSRGFPVRHLYLRPAATLYAWARGIPWEMVARDYEMAEGDLSMLILRTGDHLRHVRTLSAVFPNAAQCAEAAMNAILRDPVLPEKGEGVR